MTSDKNYKQSDVVSNKANNGLGSDALKEVTIEKIKALLQMGEGF